MVSDRLVRARRKGAPDFLGSMLGPLVLVGCLGLSLATALVDPASAGDRQAGRQKVAGVCQACHGMDGLSKNPEAPNLAGQIENYLVKAIGEYRGGVRQNESMNIIAKDLSDDDIANIAAYYASLEIEVIPP